MIVVKNPNSVKQSPHSICLHSVPTSPGQSGAPYQVGYEDESVMPSIIGIHKGNNIVEDLQDCGVDGLDDDSLDEDYNTGTYLT